MRALVLVNPDARQGAVHAESARKQLWAMGVDVVRQPSPQLQDWPEWIASHAEHVDCVVVGGGDGTLNFAVGPILQQGLRMGVLPLGTANDFARTLGIPNELDAACRCVAEGVDHRIDVGRVNNVYYLNVASIGLAVRAHRYRSAAAKQRFGVLSYASNIRAAVRDTRPFRVRVDCDGQQHALRTIQLAVGNGHYFGGGLAVSGDSSLEDGRFDVFNLEPQGLLSLLRMLPALLRGPDASIRGGQLMQGRHIRVLTRRRRGINTDGEVLTHTPAEFCMLSRALTVRVPAAYRADYERRKASAERS